MLADIRKAHCAFPDGLAQAMEQKQFFFSFSFFSVFLSLIFIFVSIHFGKENSKPKLMNNANQ